MSTYYNNQKQSQKNPTQSILQRLQLLKRSMQPQQQSLERGYQSIKTNQNQSNIKNQRLNKYLPPRQQQFQKPKLSQNNEQYQSYRQSLQKKLNYLFDKEKFIFKKQLNTHSKLLLNNNTNFKNAKQKDINYADNNHRDLEDKYLQFKTNGGQSLSHPFNKFQYGNDKYSNQVEENQNFYIRENMFNHLPINKKDEQMQQMQRKIKMLEMKYFGNYSHTNKNHSPNEHITFAVNQINTKKQKYSPQQKNRSKSNKQRQKILKKKINKSQKQIINKSSKNINKNIQNDSTCGCLSHNVHKNKKYSPNKQNHNENTKTKYPLKDYIQVQDSQKYTHKEQKQIKYNHNKAKIMTQSNQDSLHKEFDQLKSQFNELLQLNKIIIQKVEMSQQQKIAKKAKKQKAKNMLKQILFRLEQIKGQIKKQNQQKNITINPSLNYRQSGSSKKQKEKSPTKVQNTKQKQLQPFSKRDKTLSISPNSHLRKPKSISSYLPSKKIEQNKNSIQQTEKLKRLLQLQIKHRQIVQKKLQLVDGPHKKKELNNPSFQ